MGWNGMEWNASGAQALAQVSTRRVPVASGFRISHFAFVSLHGDEWAKNQTKLQLHGSSPFMHDWIEHGTERKIGIAAKQACQAAKRVWLCGMWREAQVGQAVAWTRKATFYACCNK